MCAVAGARGCGYVTGSSSVAGVCDPPWTRDAAICACPATITKAMSVCGATRPMPTARIGCASRTLALTFSPVIAILAMAFSLRTASVLFPPQVTRVLRTAGAFILACVSPIAFIAVAFPVYATEPLAPSTVTVHLMPSITLVLALRAPVSSLAAALVPDACAIPLTGTPYESDVAIADSCIETPTMVIAGS